MATHKKPGAIRQRIDAHLDQITERFIATSIERYAANDVALANRIRWELTRRSELGKRLDIHEPIRWTAIQTGLSFLVGAAIKGVADKKFSSPALWTLAVSTVLMNSIQLARLLPRYQQGLEGAVDTAVRMHEKAFPFDPFTRHAQEVAHEVSSDQQQAPWTAKISMASSPAAARIK